jgi:hypothetical protein
VLLGAIAAAVGLFIGTVGVGGILLIPALTYLAGLTVHTATATALFTFAFTGLLGTLLFSRRGSIDWRITLPVCAGAVAFSVLGAWTNSRMDARPLAILIAAIIVFAGAYILLPAREASARYRDGRSRREQVLLVAVGAASGFGSGLSGAGGPLFSVPLMVLLGFVPLAAVGTSQVLQIVAAAFGTAGNLTYGHIDFAAAAWVTAFELAGVAIGVRVAHAVSVATLRRLAASLCIAVGLLMLWRSL